MGVERGGSCAWGTNTKTSTLHALYACDDVFFYLFALVSFVYWSVVFFSVFFVHFPFFSCGCLLCIRLFDCPIPLPTLPPSIRVSLLTFAASWRTRFLRRRCSPTTGGTSDGVNVHNANSNVVIDFFDGLWSWRWPLFFFCRWVWS